MNIVLKNCYHHETFQPTLLLAVVLDNFLRQIDVAV